MLYKTLSMLCILLALGGSVFASVGFIVWLWCAALPVLKIGATMLAVALILFVFVYLFKPETETAL